MKTKIFGILIIAAALFLVTLDSCVDNSDDLLSPDDFGYIEILNNTSQSYYILIDNQHSYYCDFVERWKRKFCDLPVGSHTISLEGSNCPGKVQITSQKTNI